MMPDTGNPKPRVNSAVVIARLLGTEGFTEHVASQVKRYWMHRSGLTERQRKSIARLKKEFGEIMHGMNEGQRLIIGKYFGLLMRMQFDTGLKIGIQALLTENGNKEIDGEIHDVPLIRKQASVSLQAHRTVKGALRAARERISELEAQLREKESTVKQEYGPLPAEAGESQEAREGEA
jgi:hypothetical protein